jgi:hypothetical protein
MTFAPIDLFRITIGISRGEHSPWRGWFVFVVVFACEIFTHLNKFHDSEVKEPCDKKETLQP